MKTNKTYLLNYSHFSLHNIHHNKLETTVPRWPLPYYYLCRIVLLNINYVKLCYILFSLNIIRNIISVPAYLYLIFLMSQLQ